MKAGFDTDSEQPSRFSKLGIWYITALSVIASIALAGQVLIQQHLGNQVSDSRVVNLAGTQRYKSQGIVKLAVLLCAEMEHTHYPDKVAALENLLVVWKRGHEGLQHGDAQLSLPGHNSPQVRAMFNDINPYFDKVYASAKSIITQIKKTNADSNQWQQALCMLLDNETIFMDKMDKIVFQYDKEAREKIATLSRLEFFLLAVSIVVILLEILFIFRPTAVHVNKTITQLMTSEKNSKKLSKEIGALYSSLEKTYEELSIVNQPVENPRLLAKTDRGGNVLVVGETLSNLLAIEMKYPSMPLKDLLKGMNNPDDWMDTVVDTVSEGDTWQGDIKFESKIGIEHWFQVVITPVYNEKGEIDEWLVMGADSTKRKEAEQNMNAKNRADIEKKINQQKFRSVLILEGQEEERKRIAMDIHDGIGQMLTSLKFQIGSIDLKDKDKAQATISGIDMLTKEIIREVRKVTFNLKPTVLGDFGLQAALNVFIREIGKLADAKLVYHPQGEIERLPQKTENNIFRIIQEAVNNAIKYSEADVITVNLQQVDNELIIHVEDNGIGFDLKLVDSRNTKIESGRGFFNMYERTEYINGNLTIDSSPGKGTVVTLSVPVYTPTPV
jgi:signal transduction histidine kinase